MGEWDQFMNPTVRFFNVAHLYTKQTPVHNSKLQRIDPDWSIYTAQKENTYPPIIIFDKGQHIKSQERELCLTVIDEEAPLREYVMDLSPTAWKHLRKSIQDNGIKMAEPDDEEAQP
ncbi:hypothetical protein E4H04_10590 [Candidatus Bathyarchaeota archaeon]|nr:MAG: hypothetical protein E4H04_10590 [Candidatus Bathyarchaeota archaeon]